MKPQHAGVSDAILVVSDSTASSHLPSRTLRTCASSQSREFSVGRGPRKNIGPGGGGIIRYDCGGPESNGLNARAGGPLHGTVEAGHVEAEDNEPRTVRNESNAVAIEAVLSRFVPVPNLTPGSSLADQWRFVRDSLYRAAAFMYFPRDRSTRCRF